MESTTDYSRRVSGIMHPAAAQNAPSNALDEIISRLKTTADLTARHRDRLERIVSRAFGEGAPGVEKDTKPQAAGTVAAIIALLDVIGADLDGVERAINRLDNLA